MKKLLLTIFCLFTLICFSQSDNSLNIDKSLDDIIKLEKRAGKKKLDFKRNPNTSNYDLKYHRLEWDIDPAVHYINGNVTSYFTANEEISTVTFDLASNMNVTEVLQRGIALSYTQNANDELIITLPIIQNTGVLDSLTVTYNGIPANTGFGSFDTSTHDGTPVLSTLSEPFGAKEWWPCKQDLIDKIDSIDIYVTHPSAYKTASNGLLLSETINGSSTTTHWQHNYPIPAYLIAIAVSNYVTYSDHIDNGDFDIVNYVYPENLDFVQTRTSVAVDIMNLFSDLFEIYPYADEKYGHVEHSGFSMEHTTMSLMGDWSRDTVAHELAHQWFGNKITCGDWEDIWLNEGYATYLSALVIENFDGENAFRSWRSSAINFISSNESLLVTDPLTIGGIFNNEVYWKGAMVLHMLRYKFGDEIFFQASKNYLADPNLAYGTARTIDLQNHFENVSGTDLTEFFNDWFVGKGYPSFQLTWNQNNTSQQLNFTVNQTQSHSSVSFFETPFSIWIFAAGQAPELHRFELTENNQSFSIPLTYDVLGLEFNPLKDIVAKNNTVVLGINNNEFLNNITIYPNPTKDLLLVNNPSNIKIYDVSIYNMLGQIVYKSDKLNETISLKNFARGMYITEINTISGKVLKKIIKE
ncbi:MAG: T9SS type A sorting domain-containing protein [Flavobacteriaceae bacterium]|nr:T9SS type A sorting domain-containing protein [Flavobacteriaceae bacterium]